MRGIMLIFVFIIFIAMGVTALSATLESAGEDITNVNETWTPNAGSVTQLDDSGRTGAYYEETVTVYDENSTEMEEGTDYEWYVGNGTVKALTGGQLDGDSSATITYGYQQTTEEQREMAGMFSQLPRAAGTALPALAVIMFLIIVRGG